MCMSQLLRGIYQQDNVKHELRQNKRDSLEKKLCSNQRMKQVYLLYLPMDQPNNQETYQPSHQSTYLQTSQTTYLKTNLPTYKTNLQT